jgi:3-methyladenine DNA glycosylase AlkD
MEIHPLHLQIISELDQLSSNKHNSKERAWVQKYLGSSKTTRCIRSSEIKKLANKFTANIELINSLYENATSFDEIQVAACIVAKLKPFNNLILIDKWLNYCVGWAEVDTLCQSNFHATELLSNWSSWKKLLIKLSKDKNINKRRASLVLLCKSLGESNDSRVFDFAVEQVNKLKQEKEVLITKAISWVLRQMVKHHSKELALYLDDNRDSLPKIAYREALKKLTTGRKN